MIRKSVRIFMCAMIMVSSMAFTQSNHLKGEVFGIVSDKESTIKLASVNIVILGTGQGVSTDQNGSYRIQARPGSYILQYSMMGYQTVEKEVIVSSKTRQELDVRLIPTVYMMQGVTIIENRALKQEESVSNLTMTSKKMTRMPGSFTDVYRTLKTLPGVTSNNGMSSEFNVRGGTFDENLVIVNGVQVYRPFHIKEAPNASVAIFNMDLLKQVDLITGGFTARYGDKMSSVLDIKYRKGNPDRISGKVEGSIIHAGGILEGPLGNGSWLIGVRKSYLEYILGLLGENDTMDLHFYDIQGQLFYNITPNHQMGFQFIHSGDGYLNPEERTYHSIGNYNDISYDYYETNVDDERADYVNNLFALSFTQTLNKCLFMKTILSHYYEYENEINIEEEVWNESVYLKTYDTTYYNFGSSLEDWNQKLKIKTTEFKHDATFRLNPFHEFMTGVSIQHLDYRYQRDEEENYTWASTLAGSQDTTYNGYSEEDHECIFPTSYKIAAYVEDNWQIHDHLFANIGFRADYFHFNRDLSLSPRINFSYLTGFGGIFRAAWGYYYQSPSYKELKYSYETSRNTKAQVAIHNVFGFEYPIDSYLTFKIETYYKNFNNLISFENREGRLIYSRNNDSKGYAAGVDILLNLNLQRFSGWISYGLLKAKEDSLGGQKKFFPRATDQRHTLSFVGDVHLGAQWRLRVKALYGSGFPYTPYHYELNKDDRWNRVYSDKNSDRYPAYERLDIRLGRGFTWGKIFFDGYVEVLNVFNKENIFSYHWRYENNVWHRQATTLFPRIPNIGIAVKF